MSLGSWGEDFAFEASDRRLLTFQSRRRSGEARWAEHDVYAATPKSEFIGPGLDSITFSVRLDHQRGIVPAEVLKTLRKKRDLGTVDTLIIGEEPVFDCALRSIGEDDLRHGPDGTLLVAIVELTFKEYE